MPKIHTHTLDLFLTYTHTHESNKNGGGPAKIRWHGADCSDGGELHRRPERKVRGGTRSRKGYGSRVCFGSVTEFRFQPDFGFRLADYFGSGLDSVQFGNWVFGRMTRGGWWFHVHEFEP
ncbi:hypothetical protein OROMI_012599 [Orobanche minor]